MTKHNVRVVHFRHVQEYLTSNNWRKNYCSDNLGRDAVSDFASLGGLLIIMAW